jgi:DnaJ-class molecular chaperone
MEFLSFDSVLEHGYDRTGPWLITVHDSCSDCGGRGYNTNSSMSEDIECERCNGKGWV